MKIDSVDLIQRPHYVNLLLARRHNHMAKILMGPRRSGKSTILELFRIRLLQEGVDEEHLISFNLEDLDNASLLSPKALHDAVTARLKDQKFYYVFIDEIQCCHNFEKVVDSLILRQNIDLYVTGSNAYMLSGELATLLTGRYLPLEVMPLSFSEFRSAVASDGKNVEEDFNRYLQIGSFPALVKYREDDHYLSDYYTMLANSMIVEDIRRRFQIRDLDTLTRLIRLLASIVGSPLSARRIADTLIADGVKTSNATISVYLKALSEVYFFLSVPRFDLVGRKVLTAQEKFYLCDPGFRRHLVPTKDRALGHLLENVVYLELRRRFASVSIGQSAANEIDFVARTGSDICYFQVSLSVLDDTVFAREVGGLLKIKDNYPKFLLTMDRVGAGSDYQGIRQENVLDWLLAVPG